MYVGMLDMSEGVRMRLKAMVLKYKRKKYEN